MAAGVNERGGVMDRRRQRGRRLIVISQLRDKQVAVADLVDDPVLVVDPP
jgi:hypothetical protein